MPTSSPKTTIAETILLMPEKTDIEFEQVSAAWKNGGGEVRRLGKYWIKDDSLSRPLIAIYGNQAFAFVLAQIYDLSLISPDDALIAQLDKRWTKRNIELKKLGHLSDDDFPVFIKPVIPKIFTAGVFKSLSALHEATTGLPDDEEILVSDIVSPICAEARTFIINGEVKDIALYEGNADLVSGKSFVAEFINDCRNQLPNAVVVDIAFNDNTGWFVLEFNACWGAGLNGCNAEKVIDCIQAATKKTAP